MQKSKLFQTALGLLMMGMGAAALAAVDQANAPNFSALELDSRSPTSNLQQEVRVGIDGVLMQVDLYQSGTVDLQPFRFFINRGFGPQFIADDFSTIVTSGVGNTITVDLTAAGLLFGVGEYFVIGIQGLGPDEYPAGLSIGGNYEPGRLYKNYSFGFEPDDMAFTTYMAPVPEPAAALTLAVGLLALLGSSRRRALRSARVQSGLGIKPGCAE